MEICINGEDTSNCFFFPATNAKHTVFVVHRHNNIMTEKKKEKEKEMEKKKKKT